MLSTLRGRSTISLTKCSLEPVSCVLADAIPTVQVERTYTTREEGCVRFWVVLILWLYVPNSCNDGWDGTRASISGHASDDTQSTHDERGDSRLRLLGTGTATYH